jgi:predicted MFS family arabinose efflux permease
MLYHRYHLGSSVAGAFGLAGAAGILAAPLAGRLADRKKPELVARAGCAIAAFFFAIMGLLFLLPVKTQIALLAVSAIGFDFGVHCAMISHQTIIYGVDPLARSRLNAVFITGMFLGMSAGSSLSGWALEEWGWAGVVVLATAASLTALAIRCLPGAPGKLCSGDGEIN